MKYIILLFISITAASAQSVPDSVSIPPTMEKILLDNEKDIVELKDKALQKSNQNDNLLRILLEIKGLKPEDVEDFRYKQGKFFFRVKNKK